MKKYRVTLTAAERDELEQLLGRGKADVRRLEHAQVLLKTLLHGSVRMFILSSTDRPLIVQNWT